MRTALKPATVAVSFLLAFGLHSAKFSCALAQTGSSLPQSTPGAPFKFDVVSIRPDKSGNLPNLGDTPTLFGYKAEGVNMWQIIMTAYNPEPHSYWINARIVNPPKWVLEDKFNVEARVALSDLIAWQKQEKRELLQSALREMLKDRCHLVVHQVPSERAEFHLVLSHKKLKLRESHGTPTFSFLGHRQVYADGGVMTFETVNGRQIRHFYDATMEDLAKYLTVSSPDQPVRDLTGLTGRYDFVLEDNSDLSPDYKYTIAQWPVDNLGLTLKDGKGPGFALFIDHIEKPDAN